MGDPLRRIRLKRTNISYHLFIVFEFLTLLVVDYLQSTGSAHAWGFLYCRLLCWMSGEYPLFSLLPEVLSLGSDKPSSVHIREFGMLFRTKIEAVTVFLDQTCKK